jgi:hypothetical protein
MKGNYVVLGIELEGIRNFLHHVDSEASAQIKDAFERNDSGEFQEEDDFENALFHPIKRQEIASRAVFYELNALIEHELYTSAHRPWLDSDKYPGPKSLDLNNLTEESVRSLKTIHDRNVDYGQVIGLIEGFFKIKIMDLESAKGFQEMRNIVNAFKHRKGLIDFKKEAWKDFSFPHFYEAKIKEADQAIDNAFVFIKALWKATDREPAPMWNLDPT